MTTPTETGSTTAGRTTAGRTTAGRTTAGRTTELDRTKQLVDDPAAVDTLRQQIDALDTAVSRLITERAQLSRRIQLARINAGGARVELGRERAIHEHYRRVLGNAGVAVADAVLRVCRG